MTFDEYRAVSQTDYKMISSDVLTALLVKNECLSLFMDSNNEIARAVMLRLGANSEFNFNPNHPMGIGNLAFLDRLIEVDMIDDAIKLQGLKDDIVATSTVTTQPNKFKSLHEYRLETDSIEYTAVHQDDGDVIINLTKNVPKHNPRLLAYDADIQEYIRINSFRDVAFNGKYKCKVPREYWTYPLYVDDAYGAIG